MTARPTPEREAEIRADAVSWYGGEELLAEIDALRTERGEAERLAAHEKNLRCRHEERTRHAEGDSDRWERAHDELLIEHQRERERAERAEAALAALVVLREAARAVLSGPSDRYEAASYTSDGKFFLTPRQHAERTLRLALVYADAAAKAYDDRVRAEGVAARAKRAP